MKCIKCGTELPDGAQFCGSCGSAVAVTPVEAAAQPAAAPQPAAVAFGMQTAQPQPAAPAMPQMAEPVSGELPSYTSTTTLVKKKKSKLVPILVTVGSVAVVGTVGTVVALNCRSAIKRTFMGDNKYAASVMDNTVEKFVGAASSEDMAVTVKEVGDAVLRTAAEMEDFSGSEEEMMLYTYAGMLEAYGDAGVSAAIGLDVRASDDIKELIGDLCSDELDIDADAVTGVIDYIGSIYFAVDQKFADDVYACAVRFGGDGNDLLNAALSYNTNGDTYVSFPDAADKAVYIELPELPEVEAEDIPEIDEKEIEALLTSIDEVIDAAFEEAEVEVDSKGELEIGDASYKGTCVESVFNAELMGDTIVELAKVIESNDYIAELLEDIGGEEIDMSGLVEEAEYAAEELATLDLTFTIRNYVTSSDKIVGTQMELANEDAAVVFAILDTKDYFAVMFSADEAEYDSDDAYIDFVAEKESDTAGKGTLTVVPYGGVSFEFNVEYSDIGTTQLFGAEYPTGTYRFEIGDAIVSAMGIEGETFYIGDEEFDAADILTESFIVVKSAKDGNGIRMDIALENEELGYYGLYCTMGESTAKVPTSYDDVIDAEDMSEDDAIELLAEVVSYVAEQLFDTDAVVPVLDELGYESIDDLVDDMGYSDLEELIEEMLYYY